MDLGTGDGRAALARAAAEPATLVFGMDASAAAMAEASRRAERSRLANVIFLVAGAESLPGTALAGVADVVTVTFPWGSLLRGVVGLDAAALAGIAAALRPGGSIEALVSVTPADRVDGLDSLDAAFERPIAEAWASAGLRLETMCPATPAEIAATHSSWARRLGAGAGSGRGAGAAAGGAGAGGGAGGAGAGNSRADRPVWHLTGCRVVSDPRPTLPLSRSR